MTNSLHHQPLEPGNAQSTINETGVTTKSSSARRYDLDWLRVLVFGLLIFYHVGMFFVPWGFHIKNNVTYRDLIWPMLLLNQWRLPILFVISGMGTYYALSKRNTQQFMGERLKRLLIPLVFGMLVVVPPQVYFERLANGEFAGGYFDFWPLQAFKGIYPEGNLSWNHLWFLPYLLLYSFLLMPLFLYLRKHASGAFMQWARARAGHALGLYLFIVPLYFIEAFVEPFFPVTHALVDDWFTFVNFIVLFFYGFVLMMTKERFWQTVEENRKLFLFNGLIGFALLLGIWLGFEDSTPIHFTEALFKVFNFWSWILAIFGYGVRYLNHDSRFLRYSNEAVYPLYILHQTVTIAIGYYLIDLDWSFWTEASIMVVGTFGISVLLYELIIRRVRWLRPFFGLKQK